MKLLCFTELEAQTLDELCEAIVPGSRVAGPVIYLDSMALDLPKPALEGLRTAIAKFAGGLKAGIPIEELSGLPQFGLLRALAIEAYYSDFRQPGYDGPSAWDVTGYRSAPTAARTVQGWSFLACFRNPDCEARP